MARARQGVTLAATLIVVLSIGAANAGAALLSGILPGVVSTPAPSYCDGNAVQPFTQWGDSYNYMLAPGGSFESGPAWAASNGAKVVSGNEPYYVHAHGDSHSLYLPYGSSAVSPSMCFQFGDWRMRFFASSSGTTSRSALRVTIVDRSLLGLLSTFDAGTVNPSGSWTVTDQIDMPLTNIQGLLTTDSISFRFTPVGPGSWRIDDVYIDPWKDW